MMFTISSSFDAIISHKFILSLNFLTSDVTDSPMDFLLNTFIISFLPDYVSVFSLVGSLSKYIYDVVGSPLIFHPHLALNWNMGNWSVIVTLSF